jgi:hypothetical protein
MSLSLGGPDPAASDRTGPALDPRSRSLAFALLGLTAVGFLGLVLLRCRHGLDFTDEGFYLNWIANPWLYKFSVTQFGFFYHPLYALLQGDIVLLRQINVALTLGLALTLALMIMRGGEPQVRTTWPQRALALCLALPALAPLIVWVPTPSYNWLAIQGLLVTMIGVARFAPPDTASHIGPSTHADGPVWLSLPPLLIGTGGMMAFLAKPTTAAALGLTVLVYIVATRRKPWQLLVGIGAVTLILSVLSALAINGSISGFVQRLFDGAAAARLMSSGYSVRDVLRFDQLNPTGTETKLFWMIAATVPAMIRLAASDRLASRIIVLGLGLLTAVTAALMTRDSSWLSGIEAVPLRTGFLFGAGPFAAAMVAAVIGRQTFGTKRGFYALLLALMLAACPLMFAVGTNNNTTHFASMAAVFLGLSATVMCRAALPRPLVVPAVFAVAVPAMLITVVLVGVGMDRPYRQPTAIRLQTVPLTIGPDRRRAQVQVDADVARYVRDIERALHRAGFQRGMPMIDMTGAHPGTLFAIGAKAVGLPWMIGGYPGSNALSQLALSAVPCAELARAWLLYAPAAPGNLSDELLTAIGLGGVRDDVRYDGEAGTGPTGIQQPGEPGAHRLVKPVADPVAAAAACERYRVQAASAVSR